MSTMKRILSMVLAVVLIFTMIPVPAQAAETGNCFIMNQDCTVYHKDKTFQYASEVTRLTTNYWIELWSDITTDGPSFAGNNLTLNLNSYTITGNFTITNGLNIYGKVGSAAVYGTIYVTGGLVTLNADIEIQDWEFSGGSANFEPAPEDLAEGYEAVDNGDGTWTIQESSAVARGTCGENLTWTLDTQGVLTISGEGPMDDFDGAPWAPWNEYQITSLVIDEGVTYIGKEAFNGQQSLERVQLVNTVESIGASAFAACIALTEITIPASVTEIGDYAFLYCGELHSIWVDENNPAYSSDEHGALFDKEKTVLIQGVSTDSGSYTVPDGVAIIATGAFSSPDHLTSVTISDSVTTIEAGAFAGCRRLADVVIGNGVEVIGDYAFQGCDNLTNLKILSGVLTLGDYVFSDSDTLNGMVFCGDAPRFSSATFGDWTGIVCYPADNSTWTSVIQNQYGGAIAWEPYVENIVASGTCGENLTWTLDVDGVLTISGEGTMTAYGGTDQPWYDYRDSVVRVVVEENVTSIGDYAFISHSNLESISIASTVSKIGQFAFYGCSVLDNVVIPEGITELSNYLFYDCDGLVNLQLPSTLQTIGSYSLADCLNFGDLVIPEGVKRIDGYAFYISCWESLSLPDSLTIVGEYVFSNCGGVKGTITTPKNVNYIAWGQYCMCGNLNEVYVADGVGRIESYAFRYCQSLRDIWIPESVTNIYGNAFYGCTPSLITIHGYAGSAAETFAKSNGFVFEEILPALEIMSQPVDVSAAAGETVTFSVEVNREDVTYQWQYRSPGKTSWNISTGVGADTASITVEVLEKRNGQSYRCVITDSEGNEVASNAATMTVVEPEIEDLIITIDPVDPVVPENTVLNFTVMANREDVTYQWQYRSPGKTSWYDSTGNGADTNVLEVTALAKRDGQSYRCIVTTSEGVSYISPETTLTIAQSAPDTALEIIKQPENQTVKIDEIAIFSVEANGDDLSYQWEYSTNGNYWYASSMTGADSDTLEVIALTKRDGQMYRCVITDAVGNTVTSDAAVLTVTAKESSLTIVGHPENQTAAIGEIVTFCVEATGDNLTYQWQYSTNGTYWYSSSMTGAKTNTLSVEAIAKRNGQMYRCVITDAYGNEVVSDSAVLTISEKMEELVIISQPEDCSAAVGETVTFYVEAAGVGLTYQWQYSNNGGTYWYNSGMTGAKTDTLTVEAQTKRNGQMYRCVVTDVVGCTVTSEAVTLIVE